MALQMGFPDVAKAHAAIQRVFPVLDRASRISAASKDGIMNEKGAAGEVELQVGGFPGPCNVCVCVCVCV
jgi:hypothetical protein